MPNPSFLLLAATSLTPAAHASTTAMQAFCDIPLECSDCATADRSQINRLIGQQMDVWRGQHTNGDALIATIPRGRPHQRGAGIRNLASEHGVAQCAIADVMDAFYLGEAMSQIQRYGEQCQGTVTCKNPGEPDCDNAALTEGLQNLQRIQVEVSEVLAGRDTPAAAWTDHPLAPRIFEAVLVYPAGAPATLASTLESNLSNAIASCTADHPLRTP